ncbi:MAG TPA: hypothetical protein VLX28_18220, partial [Thermoanaerobaculia bacterium]|nr:hypothetical protein [Thermoanaerobaculia bacterium]
SAITGPVAVGGAEISPRLVSRLLNDVGDNPDQLPILQHALMRTWDAREADHAAGEPLDLRHYEAIGTMGEALSQHAEEALAELDDEGKRLAETLFKALTEKGLDGRGIRRPATLAEVSALAGKDEAALTAVVERFRLPGRSFLMPPVGAPLHAATFLDISHESLMRIWERLCAWVDEEAQSAQVYLGVARAAAHHEEGTAALWRDPELQVALTWRQEKQPTESWAQRYDPGFGRAMRFLDASEEERRQEIAAREAHRRSQQSQRLWRGLAWLLSAAALVTLAFGAYAFVMKDRSEKAKIEAEQQKRNADLQRTAAIQQQQEALHQKSKAEAQQQEALRQKGIADRERTLAETQSQVAIEQKLVADEQRKRAEAQQLQARAKEAEANAARLEADGQRKQAEQAKVRAEELRGQAEASEAEAQRLGRLALARTAALQVLRLPDDQDELSARVALRAYRLHLDNGGSPDEPALFNALRAAVERQRLRQKLSPQPAWSDVQDAVRAVAVSPQGTALFAGSEDGRLRRLDLLHPGAPGTDLAVFRKGVRAVAVNETGSLLAAGSADGSLRVLDLRAPGSVRELTVPGAALTAVAFQPGGNLLAASRSNGDVSLWDLGNPAAPPLRLGPISQGTAQATAVAFSADGLTLAAGLGKGGALLWNVREPSKPPEGRCTEKDVRSVAFGLKRNVLACGTAEGEIFLDPGVSRIPARSLLGHRSSVSSLEFGEEDRVLVSGSADHTARLWSLTASNPEPTVLAGHSSWVWTVAFLPGGDQVVSGGADRTVRLWQARAKNLVNELCRKATPPLERKELNR